MLNDVLIVGAGPTGLLLAAALARCGIRPRLIDKKPHPSDKSKALAVFARTLEVFDDFSIADEAIERGRKLQGLVLHTDGEKIGQINTAELDSPFPFILCLPQYDTERLLGRLVESLGVEIEWSVELTAIEPDVDGVTAILSHPDGQIESCRADWLISCEGVHSLVREQSGLKYEGVDIPARFIFTDARLDWRLSPAEGQAFFSQGGALVGIPLPQEGYWRVIADLPPGADPPENPDMAWFQQLIAERTDLTARLTDPIWISEFGVHQRKVSQYRTGRIFLAGDAAHSHSPVGAQGMNTGLQDAYNLAWKLALVIQGVGRTDLLDSYQAEREPIARAVLTGTEWATRAVTWHHPVSQKVRQRLLRMLISFELIQHKAVETLSELNLDYRHSPLVDEYRPPLLRMDLGRRAGSEESALTERMSFGQGPRAGDRAPDAVLQTDEGGNRLFHLLRGGQHNLLLFGGSVAAETEYAKLSKIAEKIRRDFEPYITSHIVMMGQRKPEFLASETAVLLDPQAECHRRYGAGSACLYLIRPDGYVGFRCQPPEIDRLKTYLRKIFI